MGSNGFKNTIRIVAAVYVGYLGFQLLGEEARKGGILMPIVGVAFILAALFIIFITLRKNVKAGQVKLDDMGSEEADGEDNEEAEQIEEAENSDDAESIEDTEPIEETEKSENAEPIEVTEAKEGSELIEETESETEEQVD